VAAAVQEEPHGDEHHDRDRQALDQVCPATTARQSLDALGQDGRAGLVRMRADHDVHLTSLES
jgi:hypothetical protein